MAIAQVSCSDNPSLSLRHSLLTSHLNLQFKIASLLSAVAFALPLVAAHGHTDMHSFGGVDHPGWNPSNPQAYNNGTTAQRPSANSDQGKFGVFGRQNKTKNLC
jgi:hypothetical protein